MTEQEEQYFHFESSINRLNNALWILEEVKRHKSHSLAGPAFQFALIEYSKPYTVSYGAELNDKGKPKHKHLLDERHIPAHHRALHDRLLTARKTIQAHDDLSVKEPRVYVTNTQSGKIVGAVQNVIHGTEEIANIDAIIDLIEQSLVSMYVEAEQRKSTLPFNL